MQISVQDISNQLKKNGVVSLKNLLDENSVNKILKKVKKPKKGSIESFYPVFLKQYLAKLVKLDFKKINDSLFLKKIAEKFKFKEIVENSTGEKAELQMIDCYYNEASNEKIINWHNDIGFKDLNENKSIKNFYDTSKATLYGAKNKQSARGIKFFLYLTDVQCNNGSLAIIPNSNEVVKNICSLILEKKIDLREFWRLESLRKIVCEENVKNLLSDKIGEEKVNNFIENTSFINNEKKDTLKFDFELNKGSIVIFDELCVHRGAAPQKNSRLVLRFIYRKK